jgi:hypothetical protein
LLDMSSKADAIAQKRLRSPLLLGIQGVSGLGLPSGRLTVYLEKDDAAVRRRVLDVAAKAAPEARLEFQVTGPFRAQ